MRHRARIASFCKIVVLVGGLTLSISACGEKKEKSEVSVSEAETAISTGTEIDSTLSQAVSIGNNDVAAANIDASTLVRNPQARTCETVSRQSSSESALTSSTDFSQPLANEKLGIVNYLSVPYPDSWIFMHDANFHSMIDGRFVVFDTAAEAGGMKGSFHGGRIGGFDVSQKRKEAYVATTYHDRGIRGERRDVLSIYDLCTFEQKAELKLPPKLISAAPLKNKFRMSNDERFGFAYNFTPAASVAIIDLEKFSVVNEVSTPGCSLVYPMGDHSFASVCGDGSIAGYELDQNGQLIRESRTEKVIDFDQEPMFMKPARLGHTLSFPTFYGQMHRFDLSGDTPVYLGMSRLINDEEASSNWRPGGWQLITSNKKRNEIYVLMHQDGAEGTHKNPGTDVWVYDANTIEKKRVITLQVPSISIVATGDTLVATNVEMNLDVYNLNDGSFERMIGGAALTPLIAYDSAGN